MNEKAADPLDEIARGAWTRLRNLIGALDRVDRLETSEEYIGWLQKLATDESVLERTAKEFILRAVRLAADPINWLVLVRLAENEAATTAELSGMTGIQRVEIVERLNELARAGLTLQSLEGDRVAVTDLGRGMIAFVGQVTQRMTDLAAKDYLVNHRMSPSRLENRVSSTKAR